VQPDELAARFGATISPSDDPYAQRYNAAPTQHLPVILNDGEPQIVMLRWGLVPFWSKGIDAKYSMINARSETLLEKPAFKQALQRRRCLVLADGFYEWKKTPDGKLPMRITLAHGELFAFAGLWDNWKNPEGGVVRSFTIITTDANELMKPIHDRMPVILHRDDEREWLNNDAGIEQWQHLMRQYEPDQMRAYLVSKRVNVATRDEPSLIEPVA
jgi:putative SOS response-associated peptidase YedK